MSWVIINTAPINWNNSGIFHMLAHFISFRYILTSSIARSYGRPSFRLLQEPPYCFP
jgi:hypothetical protein